MARNLGTVFLLISLSCAPDMGRAALITFDFGESPDSFAGLALDGLSTGSVVRTGPGFDVAMTARAGTPGSGDRFNHTGSPNFGINASGSGDVTDALDAGAGPSEFMELSFTATIPAAFELVELDFDRISGSGEPGEDAGTLQFTNGISFDFSGATVDSADRLGVGIAFAAADTVRLAHVAGNGFGLESLVLDVRPEPATTVPEGSSLVLLGLGSGIILCLERLKILRQSAGTRPR